MKGYKETVESLAAARASKSTTNYSRSELDTLAGAMLNDTETDIPVYIKKGDQFEVSAVRPGKRVRDCVIAPVLKGFGIDKSEMSKLDDFPIPRSGGEAMAEFSLMLVKEYLTKVGRKLTLPMTSDKEASMTIYTDEEKEKSIDANIIRRGEDGVYTVEPSNKTVVTAAHTKLCATNKSPAWIKKTIEKK